MSFGEGTTEGSTSRPRPASGSSASGFKTC